MDSFEWNKIAGAVLGTLLFVVAVRIATGFIFEVKEPAKPGYVVQGVEETTAAGAPAAPVQEALPDWGTVLPKADVAAGKSISTRCEQCHDLSKGGPNKIGPNLWAVVGRPRASHPGFDYSAAMKSKGGSWSYDELFKFLKSPGAYITGTKMSFAGLPNPKDRINIIAYLRTDMDSPAPIPPPQPAKAAAPAQTPANGKAPAAAPAKGAGAPTTTQGPNGTAAVAPGNQPATGTSTSSGAGNAASGSAGNANGPSGGEAGKDNSMGASNAHLGNAPSPATGKQPSGNPSTSTTPPPKKP
jgi:cytochrome c